MLFDKTGVLRWLNRGLSVDSWLGFFVFREDTADLTFAWPLGEVKSCVSEAALV